MLDMFRLYFDFKIFDKQKLKNCDEAFSTKQIDRCSTINNFNRTGNFSIKKLCIYVNFAPAPKRSFLFSFSLSLINFKFLPINFPFI